MQAENKEQWMAFCTRIAEEQDRHTLIALVDELNLLLEEEGQRLGILPGERSEYFTAQAQ